MKTLVLISDAFPFESVTETSFILPELKPLSKAFDKIIIAPVIKPGTIPDVKSFPDNVEISETLIFNPTIGNRLRGLGMMENAKALLYDIIHSGGSLREISAYSSYVGMALKNLKKLIRDNRLNLSETLFYTFWFNFSTAALTQIPGARIVTRTHGHDLYEDRYFISSWWRKKSLEKISACYAVSEAGRRYLTDRFPEYADKIHLSRLGTVNDDQPHPAILNRNQLSLLGISRLSPEKGMTRQFNALLTYAEHHPEKQIEYVHIGDGSLMPEIRRLTMNAPGNLTIELKGALHNSAVHDILKSRHWDASILLSFTEGGCPVALCESLSYGIPCIATSVGGITEMLEHGGGVLLDDDFNQDSFDMAVNAIQENRERLAQEAYDTWKVRFRAEPLREKFADEIMGIMGK